MNRKNAMSALGYAIAFVIFLAVVMIISTPMIVDKYNGEPQNVDRVETVEKHYTPSSGAELRNLEARLTSRIERLEQNQPSTVSNKYVCTIEGNLDSDGSVVPVGSRSDLKKFVFVCEYMI